MENKNNKKHFGRTVRNVGTPEQEKEKIKLEQLKWLVPVRSAEQWKKSLQEKAELKRAIELHKRALVKAGFNPIKRMNISEPMLIIL